MPIQADYTTLSELKNLRGVALDDDGDDAKFKRLIMAASKWFQQATRRTYVPYTATRTFRRDALLSIYQLAMDEDLLAVSSITNGNASSITDDQYSLIPDNTYPKDEIRLLEGGAIYWTFSQLYSTVSVVGIWGYHDDYANAWGDSLDTVENNPLSNSATTVTVNSCTGLDDRGLTRFGVGDYLLIEDEQLKVIEVNVPAKTLTVRRAQNGTTAVSHVQDTAISVYRQVPDVQWAVTYLANWLYDRRDSTADRVQFADGTAIIPSNAPPEVRLIADRYTRVAPLIRGV